MSWWQSDFQILFSPTWPSWNIYRYTLKYIGIKKKYWHFDNLNSQQITLTFFFCANASKTKQFENAQIARASTLESESELLIIQYSIQWVHYLLVILCILFIMRSCQTVSRQSENLDILQSIQSLERTISQSILEASWIMFPSADFQHLILWKCKWKWPWKWKHGENECASAFFYKFVFQQAHNMSPLMNILGSLYTPVGSNKKSLSYGAQL